MHIKVIVNWRERFEGKTAVYLTGVESFGPGELKISGDFGPVKMYCPTELECDVVGRMYEGNYSLRVLNKESMKMKVLSDARVDELRKALT